MNITLSIDEQVADSARKAAQSMGKSLNQAVRDYLEQLAGGQQLEADRRRGGCGAGVSIATKPTAVRSFLDTNILLYADAGDEAIKQRRALALISEHRLAGSAVISAQVLQEYTNVAVRKLGLPAALARERLSFYARFEVVTTTSALIADAFDLHVLRGVAFYDAMIVQAAIASGCARLFSEDMQDGAVHAGVRIVNPFKD
jgi:predicted nucleic acid-binding protein